MTRDEALAELHEIVHGIDQDQVGADDGWWETSVGAEFGATKLASIEDLIRQLTPA